MAVGCILRVSWICLLLFGGTLPFPSLRGYSYTSKTDHPDIGGDTDDKLETSKTLMFDAYSLAKGYSDRRKKVPLVADPKQPLLTPKEGARNQGGGAVEFGQKNAKIEDQKLVKPVTFPLNSPYQHDYSFEEQWGSRKPQFPSAYKPSTKQSSKLRKAGSDLLPPTLDILMDDGAFSSGHNLESESGRYFNPAQHLNFQAGERQGSLIYADQPSTLSYASYRSGKEAALTVGAQTLEDGAVYSSSSLHLDLPAGAQEGSQSYSPNLVYENLFQYPAAETAQLPSEEGVPSNDDTVNVVQQSSWSSDRYITREEPVFSSWAQVAPTISAQTLQADAVSSTDTKGGYSSSSLNHDVPAGKPYGSQSYSPNLVYEDVFQYPAAENAQLPSEEGVPSNDDTVNVVQQSSWSSDRYMTREKPVFYSNSDYVAQAAPVETPVYPSYVADLTLDSTSSKAAPQPVLFEPLKKAPRLPSSQLVRRPKNVRHQSASTYIVQSKGGYSRGRQMLSRKKYFSGFPPPPPPHVLKALKPQSETVRGKW